MIAKVTQYYRPDGRQVDHEITLKDDCKEKYDQIMTVGRLTCEQLMTGMVSQAVECEDFDFDIILSDGKSLLKNKESLEKLILRFDLAKCKEMYNAVS